MAEACPPAPIHSHPGLPCHLQSSNEASRRPSDELKSVAPPPLSPRASPSPQPIHAPAETGKRGDGLGLEGGLGVGGRTSSLIALVTAGREGVSGRREGGGNPMRLREARQREGNASQHRGSRSLAISAPRCRSVETLHLHFSLSLRSCSFI